MRTFDFGLVGLAVMGANLARNLTSRGFSVVTYNRSPARTEAFVREHGNERLAGETGSVAEFVAHIERPRKILIMVQAGQAVDAVIGNLFPYLEPGDLVADCGNSYYRDSVRREAFLSSKGIRFMGCGVSGGEEGALKGPSIMPGGSPEAYAMAKPAFEAIAARDFEGGPCVVRVGSGGSGHYVKMVHNGIEYAVMQMMAEAYDLLRAAGLSAPEIADVFDRYRKGELGSYLFDIAVPVLRREDTFVSGGHLVDFILDIAGQKGTGKWTAIDALERGVAVPSIAEAVFARSVSANRELRVGLSGIKTPASSPVPSREKLETMLEGALIASVLSAYAQGYDLIAQASHEEGWGVDLAEVSRIWQGGCIIRAKVLALLARAFRCNSAEVPHLFAVAPVAAAVSANAAAWRETVSTAVGLGVPVPAISSALAYAESVTSKRLPANFLQGLRDYFGAHTYERTDREGAFHTEWMEG